METAQILKRRRSHFNFIEILSISQRPCYFKKRLNFQPFHTRTVETLLNTLKPNLLTSCRTKEKKTFDKNNYFGSLLPNIFPLSFDRKMVKFDKVYHLRFSVFCLSCLSFRAFMDTLQDQKSLLT